MKMTRREARDMAFRIIFEMEFKRDEDFNDIYIEYLDNNETEADDYVRNVFLGVCEKLIIIDDYIEKASIRRKNERISKVTLAIMRLAIYEMINLEDVPVSIAINEAVELAKKYEDENVPGFVNGLLGNVAKMLNVE